MKLVVFVSHPIQHFTQWFQEISQILDGELTVCYASRHGIVESYDPEFAESFSWDTDLLSGYRAVFHGRNLLANPGDGFLSIAYADLDEFFEREKPDAVLLLGWQFIGYWMCALAANRHGIPYFVRGESNLLRQGSALKWWVKKQTIGRLCRGAEACLAIGQRNADLYRSYGVSEQRIFNIPYFVDNDYFRTIQPTRENDETVFVFVGKLIEKKHPDHLLAAWLQLSESERSNSRLLFVGSGELEERLRTSAAEESNVEFVGFANRSELPALYARSDVLVLPSDQGETWGLVVNEALASGLAVLVSDKVGSAPDLVEPGVTGFTFEFGNIKQLSALLSKMVRENLATYSESSPQKVEDISPVAAAKQTVAAIEKMIQAK